MSEKKAIVIGIDGAQLEKLEETLTPNLDSLNIIESFTGGVEGTETEEQTYSGPGWGTLLTGVWANKHGIVENDDTLRANPEYPSIFEYVNNDDPNSYLASVVNWGPINDYFEEDIDSIVDFELTAPEPSDDNLAQDNFIAPTVADLILDKAPDYTFVHLDNVDVVGHDLGFSPEYLESITQADGHIGTILDAVEAREAQHPNEDWLVLVTTDHGREPTEGFDHGEQSDSERTTFIASNRELDNSPVAPATDVVPTVLDHLNIEEGKLDGESLLRDSEDKFVDNLTSLNKNSEWELQSDEEVDFFTYHPQGMTKTDEETLFLSSVEIITPTERFDEPRNGLDRTAGEGEGHLFKLDTEGNLIDSITLGEGDIYHPGGIDYDGENVWVPVAEYRPDSESTIYRVDPETMEATEVFTFPDHIGGIFRNPDTNTLHGVSWGSRRLYTWHLDDDLNVIDADAEPETLRSDNSSYYIDYQDAQYVGDNLGLFSGIQTYQDSETEEPLELGGLELVDLTSNKPVFQLPITLWTENAEGYELAMTHNPFYVETTETGLKAYFLPEDDTSRLFVYEVDSEDLPTPREEALPNTHAHNDYEHEYPLYDALSYGFVSVEADIWLYPDDNENLRVAHDPVEDPTTLPTLEELYLEPLQEFKEEYDNGGVYADGTPLTLLIDIKSEGLPTYQRLDEVLAEYNEKSPGLFTTYTQNDSGDYTITPGAVTPIISGDRPLEFMQNQEVRYAGYDGRKDDIGTGVDSEFMPLISDNWDNFFTDELAWDSTGNIPEATEAELNEVVSEVQGEDKIFRFWNLPIDAPSVWEPLYEVGVDLINTDDLEGLSEFIESQLEPVNQIIEIWEDATIDYTSVVAHRGGYYEDGVTTLPENSLATIEQAIALGVEMVELDVWKTQDNRYVIIHDETVDRTTTGSGRVEDLTLEELKELNLIIEDFGEVTSEKIPTLEEALRAVEDKIMLNIDIKLPVEELVNVMNMARELGVDEQIVIKNPVNNEEQLAAVKDTLAQLPFDVRFMPIIDDELVSDPEFVERVFNEFQPDAAEMLVRPQEGEEPVTAPGFLFSEEVKDIAEEYDVRLWINTLFANTDIDDNGFINGFRNDALALTEPDAVYGYWADAGASIQQTDESELAIDYLESNGLREPLDEDGDNTFTLGTGDRIAGAEGADEFYVSAGGNNTITGGTGADQFWIANDEIPKAANVITDFTSGEDVIGIAGLDIGFDELSISQSGADALIKIDRQDVAILSDVEADNLTADNFVFV
ncbi:DUF6454 family protein [Myxosarcina sp. GI1]|uniref:DUF6454 family protein n=1 Tax=Myxosarcina sp. GI1 TaxID=1541065 RepID=UPI0006915A41|nr:DUF6454 family protein [Myxosarcina sp. GI1]